MKPSKVYIIVCVSLSTVSGLRAISLVDAHEGQSVWVINRNIGNVLDEISPYEPTALSNADAVGSVITISSSGIYRLSEELTNRVQINVDKVDLDLNGYGISLSAAASLGLTIQSDRKKIVVRNGYVENSAASPTGDGIYAVSASGDTISDVYLNNVNVFGFDMGINFEAQSGGFVKNCHVTDCNCADTNNAGFQANGSGVECFSFTNCVAFNNGHGFILTGFSNNVINNCVVSNSSGYGFIFQSTSENNVLNNCVVSDSVNHGFYFFGSSGYNVLNSCVASNVADRGFSFEANNNEVRECIASNCGTDGFYFSSATGNFLYECTASNCGTDGFYFSATAIGNLFDECTASNNVVYGFNFFSSAAQNFLDECTARDNTTGNYTGLPGNNAFRCRDVSGATVSWQDTAGTGGWIARG